MTQTKQTSNISKADSWKMFDEISPRYDLLNRLLSFGLDIAWRNKLRKFLPAAQKMRILDVATGTADVLLTLIKDKNVSEGFGVDMAEKMLQIGRKKIVKAGLSGRLTLTHADALRIPFKDGFFNVATITFGIRNMPEPARVLKEMFRTLQPGGRALVLEFSLPENKLLRALHLFYLRSVVPAVGHLFSGHYQAYKYLNQTIEEFPYGNDFCQLLKKEGFINVKANLLLFGVATIYQADKP